MSLLNNSIGIHGGSGIITSSSINSFQMPETTGCNDFAPIPRLIYMDARQMTSPSINLENNHWINAQGVTLTGPPVQSEWFCIKSGPSHWCSSTNIPVNNIRSQGCASGPCESPKTCEYYCQLYPKDPACFNSGSGLPGFTATPNPSGGTVALSQLPEDGGVLHVFDSRGALLKVLHLSESTHQIIDLYDLHPGIYTLQLLSQTKIEQAPVRLMITD